MQKLLSQELSEDANGGTSFHDSKFPTMDGQPKELFFSSDANALIEHTKKVLVIEDDEVVHLKVLSDRIRRNLDLWDSVSVLFPLGGISFYNTECAIHVVRMLVVNFTALICGLLCKIQYLVLIFSLHIAFSFSLDMIKRSDKLCTFIKVRLLGVTY